MRSPIARTKARIRDAAKPLGGAAKREEKGLTSKQAIKEKKQE